VAIDRIDDVYEEQVPAPSSSTLAGRPVARVSEIPQGGSPGMWRRRGNQPGMRNRGCGGGKRGRGGRRGTATASGGAEVHGGE
jgi:hypothetical protein